MKILVKLPTRSRPDKALAIIQTYTNLAEDRDNIRFLLTCDDNDHTMNNAQMIRTLETFGPSVKVVFGQSLSKIHAINRDLQHAGAYDILVLASDDMICQVKGWDTILRSEMAVHFPNLDGVLFHWDGDAATGRHNDGMDAEKNRGGLNTMRIMGRRAVARFGYIYNPEYTSLWCDNEFTDVWDRVGRQYRSMDVLFKHVHFSNDGTKPDALMIKTQSFYNADAEVYRRRRAKNFDLK